MLKAFKGEAVDRVPVGFWHHFTTEEEWLKGFVGKGFETFSLNFHMSLEGTDLDKLALTTDKLLAGTDSKITTLGYYCNPIQYAEHRKTLEKVICTAEKFGATHVSTFARSLGRKTGRIRIRRVRKSVP